MVNGMANGNWKRASKKMASIAIGVFLGQWISHPNDFTTWVIVWNTFRTISITIFFMELGYIQTWLYNGNGGSDENDKSNPNSGTGAGH